MKQLNFEKSIKSILKHEIVYEENSINNDERPLQEGITHFINQKSNIHVRSKRIIQD
jgi:hypothetical protein